MIINAEYVAALIISIWSQSLPLRICVVQPLLGRKGIGPRRLIVNKATHLMDTTSSFLSEEKGYTGDAAFVGALAAEEPKKGGEMLTAEQQELRRGKLTSSAVGVLMRGDAAEITNLWRLLVGSPDYVESNLDNVWPVQLGNVTEQLHLDWLQRKHGPILRRGAVVPHPNGWAACTLDGWACSLECPVEVKHLGGYEKHDVILSRYMPQLTWTMGVCSTKRILFSTIEGAREPQGEIIELDEAYSEELWCRATLFIDCVRNLTPPVELPPVAPPLKSTKEYSMAHSNSWIANAAKWAMNKVAAGDFADAAKELKEAVPSDAQRCHGGGIEVKRNKSGSLTIKEIK